MRPKLIIRMGGKMFRLAFSCPVADAMKIRSSADDRHLLWKKTSNVEEVTTP
jgi:hypothetical protein